MAGLAVRAKLEGDKPALRRLRRLAGDQGMRKELRGAVKELGEEKLPIVVERTPRRTGRLQRSERLLVLVSPKREEIRISLVAGGAAAPYAARVHETHKTKPKFIESVILEAARTAAADISGKIDARRAMGS